MEGRADPHRGAVAAAGRRAGRRSAGAGTSCCPWKRRARPGGTRPGGAESGGAGWRPRPSVPTVPSASGPATWSAATARTAPTAPGPGPLPGPDAARELLRADVSGVEVADRRFQRLEHGLAIAATREGVTRVMVHEFGAPPPNAAAPNRTSRRSPTSGARHRRGHQPGHPPVGQRLRRRQPAARPLPARSVLRSPGRGAPADAERRTGPQPGRPGRLQPRLGSSPPSSAAARARTSWTPTTPSATPWAARSANIRPQVELLLGGPEVEPARALLTELVALDGVRQHLAGMISGLGIRYDVEGAEGCGAGDLLRGRRRPGRRRRPRDPLRRAPVARTAVAGRVAAARQRVAALRHHRPVVAARRRSPRRPGRRRRRLGAAIR